MRYTKATFSSGFCYGLHRDRQTSKSSHGPSDGCHPGRRRDWHSGPGCTGTVTYHDDIHVSANEPASHGEVTVAATAASAGDDSDSEPVTVDTGGTCHRDRDTVTRASG
jgi:hypothetical protein